MTHKTP